MMIAVWAQKHLNIQREALRNPTTVTSGTFCGERMDHDGSITLRSNPPTLLLQALNAPCIDTALEIQTKWSFPIEDPTSPHFATTPWDCSVIISLSKHEGQGTDELLEAVLEKGCLTASQPPPKPIQNPHRVLILAETGTPHNTKIDALREAHRGQVDISNIAIIPAMRIPSIATHNGWAYAPSGTLQNDRNDGHPTWGHRGPSIPGSRNSKGIYVYLITSHADTATIKDLLNHAAAKELELCIAGISSPLPTSEIEWPIKWIPPGGAETALSLPVVLSDPLSKTSVPQENRASAAPEMGAAVLKEDIAKYASTTTSQSKATEIAIRETVGRLVDLSKVFEPNLAAQTRSLHARTGSRAPHPTSTAWQPTHNCDLCSAAVSRGFIIEAITHGPKRRKREKKNPKTPPKRKPQPHTHPAAEKLHRHRCSTLTSQVNAAWGIAPEQVPMPTSMAKQLKPHETNERHKRKKAKSETSDPPNPETTDDDCAPTPQRDTQPIPKEIRDLITSAMQLPIRACLTCATPVILEKLKKDKRKANWSDQKLLWNEICSLTQIQPQTLRAVTELEWDDSNYDILG